MINCLALVLSVTWFAACKTALTLDVGPRIHRIHIASNGWHSAIVVSAPALNATDALPEAADFPNAAFLEFGWGDRAYYPAKKKTSGMTLSALFIPTPAIIHMAALQDPPEDDGTGFKVISLELTKEGFQRLVQAIAADFKRPPDGRAKSVSLGLYSDSRFYHARGKFHLFNTCNTWTARILHEGGIPLSPSGIATAEELMNRLRLVLKHEY